MQHHFAHSRFNTLLKTYSSSQAQIGGLWNELEQHYSSVGRYYHTLNHVSGLIAVLDTATEHVECMEALLFAAFYHDVIYDVLQQDNEERSADLATQRLAELNMPAKVAQLCNRHILATKKHEYSDCTDTNLFTDADLAILGAVPALYDEYRANIRREYCIYPDEIYRQGRIKVLEHFLAMPTIYKTSFFRERYEAQARENITAELAELKS